MLYAPQVDKSKSLVGHSGSTNVGSALYIQVKVDDDKKILCAPQVRRLSGAQWKHLRISFQTKPGFKGNLFLERIGNILKENTIGTEIELLISSEVIELYIFTIEALQCKRIDIGRVCNAAMGGAAVRTALLCAIMLLPHAEESSCPARASPCSSDDECGEQVCCQSSCGRVCVDPLFTGKTFSFKLISRTCKTDGCENIKLSTERISRALAADNSRGGRGKLPSMRSPRCRVTDGEMLCPLGFDLDARGCPLCKCRDPCLGVTCPGQLSCQLEETPCLRPPCPPVPTCLSCAAQTQANPTAHHCTDALWRNDYGVCCPASLELQKAGTCPAPTTSDVDCGTPCAHDLECSSMQKCCDGGECGRHCILPNNVTMCTQQKMLAELLVVSEREGRGYVPQCANDGACVDAEGNKLRGSMGPSSSVQCSPSPLPARTGARSLTSCSRALCAGICEYGYKTGADGCPTCECDDPCAGYPCKEGEECIRVRDSDCRPRVSYENPCEAGTPATDDNGSVVACGADSDCPSEHVCTLTRRSSAALCCPDTMCEYLRDFDEKMEGTVDGMKLALPAPTCKQDGSFSSQQCAKGRVRTELSCLELTCRMGCDYGFELGAERCPTCRCRDPCAGVTCPAGRACSTVDVACDADYCPPSPSTPHGSGERKPTSVDMGAEVQRRRYIRDYSGCNEEVICPYGRELDETGCLTCDCKDPCAEAECRADETCELVPLDCECPDGVEPLQAPDSKGPLVCGPSAAACPSTHACRFAPHDSRPSFCCPKPHEGTCSSGEVLNTTRWLFNHERNRCERFRYHGCSGNHNNFRSKDEFANGTAELSLLKTGLKIIDEGTSQQARKWVHRDPLDEHAKADEGTYCSMSPAE
ncbi:Uncharacterized protein OBRU01_10598 [Operophtera brumata]|uniref:Uncharacterized protein n=1 Tax=Operophtera brumata TaxID=104452 RepID=A0A0L7LCD5_OPEBR|nr:Uncharacterized protein OBRU01_10598 [Operophtera brumata]